MPSNVTATDDATIADDNYLDDILQTKDSATSSYFEPDEEEPSVPGLKRRDVRVETDDAGNGKSVHEENNSDEETESAVDDSKVEVECTGKFEKKRNTDTKKERKNYDYATKINYLFRECRFFLIKSNNEENVVLAKEKCVWSTPPANEAKLNRAFHEARNVILLYSVRESGKFCGFARLASTSRHDVPPIEWKLPAGISARALGGVFKIDWISKQDVAFEEIRHLFNCWNGNRPAKVGRDGQEIDPDCGRELCKIFGEDPNIELTSILRKSKESARLQRLIPDYERETMIPVDMPIDPQVIPVPQLDPAVITTRSNYRLPGSDFRHFSSSAGHHHPTELFTRKRRFEDSSAVYHSIPTIVRHSQIDERGDLRIKRFRGDDFEDDMRGGGRSRLISRDDIYEGRSYHNNRSSRRYSPYGHQDDSHLSLGELRRREAPDLYSQNRVRYHTIPSGHSSTSSNRRITVVRR